MGDAGMKRPLSDPSVGPICRTGVLPETEDEGTRRPPVSIRYLLNYESPIPPFPDPLFDDGTANARLATVPGRDRSSWRRRMGVTEDEPRGRDDLRSGVPFIPTPSDDGNGSGDDMSIKLQSPKREAK